MTVPDPTHPYPLPAHEQFCVFLRPTITSEKVRVGEYTYYDAAWWNWPIELVSAHAATLMTGTPADIAGIADQYIHRHLR
ncbi:MAG: hypothetical protein M3228_08835 [Actinomycetota bacterium]|nr:hypothetical protein [Actinomycetota bacterium]